MAGHRRVALIADTHGYLDPRIAGLIQDCDIAVHAGDIGHAQLLRQLSQICGKVIAVRGNNDVPAKWPVADRSVLDQLPWEHMLGLPGGELAVVHGHRSGKVKDRHDNLRRRYPGARAVVYGHSHRLVCDRTTTTWVLNPGAAGRARTYGGPSCLVLDAGPRSWQIESHCFPPLK